MGAFIPYADPTKAAATIAPAQYQFGSIAPFQNNNTGIQDAYNTPGYQTSAVNQAYINGSYGDTGASGTGGAGGSGGAGGTGGAGGVDLSQYDQGIANINSGIGRLDNQQSIGLQNIDSGYNSALNQLLQGKATTQQTYNTNKNQTTQDYVGAKNTIGQNAGSSLTGVQRLLGARGAGGSSAALFNAPQAVALQASQQRAGAGQTFGHNNQALDTSWNTYLTGEQGDEKNLGDQRTNNQNGLKASIANTRANLLQSLATLQGQRAAASGGNAVSAAQPYLDQANGYLGQADSLGLNVPTYQVNPTVYQAPSLDSYTASQFATPQSSGSGALDSSLSPYLSLLLGKDKNQQPNFGF